MQKKFSNLLHDPLIWKSDGLFKQSYTLYHNERSIAHFRQESGLFKSDASIYLTGASEPLFVFRPKGLFGTTIEVESTDIDFEAAKLKPNRWGGGIAIHFANGNRYAWRKVNFWGSKWMLESADLGKIAKLEVRHGWTTKGVITVVSDAPAPAELNLLIFAGWTQYLFELQAAAAG